MAKLVNWLSLPLECQTGAQVEAEFKIGDRVRFMDFDGDGTVVALPQRGMLDIDVEGMRMRVSVSEVVRLSAEDCAHERQLYDGNNQISRFKQPQPPVAHSLPSGKKAQRQAGRMEVDLHIEKIRERYPAARNIPDSDALYAQLDVFEKSMAEAFRKGLRSVVFIHGNGRGVLRSELLKRLREYPGAVVQEASPLRYGNGAIEVFIK